MGTQTRFHNIEYKTTEAAGATEIYYPVNNYENMTIFIEPVSGGTASVTVTGESLAIVEAGSATWHAGSATLTGATANVYDGTEYGLTALTLSATTKAATFIVVMKGHGY